MERIVGVEEALQHWYEQKSPKGLSWQFLGSKVGKSGSYISRVARGECKASFEVERDVLAYIYRGREKEVFAYLEGKYPAQVTRLASLTADLGESLKFPKRSFYEIVTDRLLYHIYRLSDACIYTIGDLNRIVGCDVSLRVRRLEDLGCVEVVGGVVQRSMDADSHVNVNFKATLESFSHNLAILGARLEEDELGGTPFNSAQNKLLGLYECVNEKALLHAIDTINSCISKVRADLNAPGSEGDIPIFINTTIGRFDTNQVLGEY